MFTILRFLLISLLCFCISNCVAQISLNNTFRINEQSRLSSVTEYIKLHKIDYALISWHTSNWLSSEDNYMCYFKRGNEQSLVSIKAPTFLPVGFPYKLTIKDRTLNALQADSLMKVIKPDSAFIFTQQDFNILREPCTYKKNGKVYQPSIMDAGTVFLYRYDNGKVDLLNFNAPVFNFTNCYPHVREFIILKGFINTTSKLRL